MTSYPPPYRPFRGAGPPHFVDREDPDDVGVNGIVAASIAAYAAGPRDPRFHRLVTSGPAMGKTALLRAIGRQVADRLGWAVTFHRCQVKERAIRAVSTEVAKTLQKQWPTELTGTCCRLGDFRPLSTGVARRSAGARGGGRVERGPSI